MKYEEAIEKHGGRESLSPYEKGVVVGLLMYAWMKDGTTYVGKTGTTLGGAIDRFLTESRKGRRIHA